MALLAIAAILDALDGRIARALKRHVADGRGDRLAGRRGELRCRTGVHRLRAHCCRTRGSAGSWCCSTRCASCCGWPGSTRCSTWTSPPTRRSTSSACPRRQARSARSGRWRPRCSSATAGGHRSGRWCIWMVGVSLLVVSTLPMRKIHTFAVPPNMVAPLLALLAIARGRVDSLRLHHDPGDHRRLRHPHPVRGPHQALAGGAPGGVGRQTTSNNARRGGRSAAAQPAPPVHERLGLRRPGG